MIAGETDPRAAIDRLIGYNGATEPGPIERPWPTIDEAAYAGLAGDVVFQLAPHTEADEVATLMSLLVLAGCAAGRAPHYQIGESRHSTNLFAVLVGATSKARKGTSLAGPERLIGMADERFVRERRIDGLSSGEGLIWQVRDEVRRTDKQGNEFVEVPGVTDKRLMCIEEEFASLLAVADRQGNTLSPVIRRAWDARGTLASTTKNSPARATNPHISILGHVTVDEIKRTLTDVAMANGLGNRFLWALVKRSKALPHPGRIEDDEATILADGLRRALAFAAEERAYEQDAAARKLWSDVYPPLSEGKPGLSGALMARAEVQVLRLALIYAVLARSDMIRAADITSALAVWNYCERSVVYVFGDSTGDPEADRILAALRYNGPMGKTDLHELFGRNISARKLDRALELLVTLSLIHSSPSQGPSGRQTMVWSALPNS